MSNVRLCQQCAEFLYNLWWRWRERESARVSASVSCHRPCLQNVIWQQMTAILTAGFTSCLTHPADHKVCKSPLYVCFPIQNFASGANHLLCCIYASGVGHKKWLCVLSLCKMSIVSSTNSATGDLSGWYRLITSVTSSSEDVGF